MAIDDTTAKLLAAAIVTLWGTTTSLVVYIRHLYGERDAIRLATIADIRAQHERDRTDWQRQKEQLERRQADRDEKDDQYLKSLESAVELLRIQAKVTTAAIERTEAAPPRRRATGDD